MKKNLSRIVKWQLLCMAFFMVGTAFAQDLDGKRKDSLDRYGAAGIRPGVFFNLNKNNQFTLPLLGAFMDYSFGKFHHSIEIDFLTRKPHKFFKNAYSPCFTYGFSMKAKTWGKWEARPGVFVNCRKDVQSRKQYFYPNDTIFSSTNSGFHTVFSLGPSAEMSRKIFFAGKKSFLIVGARIAYSFDVLGYGTALFTPQSMSTDIGKKIRSKDRLQRDVFAFTLKIGWGKLIEQIEKKDLGLDMVEF